MGNFRVAVDIANVAGGRFEHLDALVDTGATYTWVSRDILDRLGVAPEEEWPFVLADGREVKYPIGAVRLRFASRTRSTVAIFGEPESEALLGVVTLEELGLAADPVNRRLVPVPGLLKLANPWTGREGLALQQAALAKGWSDPALDVYNAD